MKLKIGKHVLMSPTRLRQDIDDLLSSSMGTLGTPYNTAIELIWNSIAWSMMWVYLGLKEVLVEAQDR